MKPTAYHVHNRSLEIPCHEYGDSVRLHGAIAQRGVKYRKRDTNCRREIWWLSVHCGVRVAVHECRSGCLCTAVSDWLRTAMSEWLSVHCGVGVTVH